MIPSKTYYGGPFMDRVVHHAIHRVIEPLLISFFLIVSMPVVRVGTIVLQRKRFYEIANVEALIAMC